MNKKRFAVRAAAFAASGLLWLAGSAMPAAAQGETTFSFTFEEEEESVPVPDTGDATSFALPILSLGFAAVFGTAACKTARRRS